MKKLILLPVFLLVGLPLTGQTPYNPIHSEGTKEYTLIQPEHMDINDNPYDKLPPESRNSKLILRERWYNEQRMYPFNFIPYEKEIAAEQERDRMVRESGSMRALVPWVSKGPMPIISGTGENNSGRMVAVKYDPVNPDIIYAGGATGGVWKTTNGGANWFPIADFEVSINTGAIEIDPANTNIIYFGTGASYDGTNKKGRGLLKSTDGGATWTNYTTGLPDPSVFTRLVLRPGTSNELFASCGPSGLYKSMDAGVTWTQVLSGRCDDIVFSPDGNNAYIIGKGTGYRRSTDGGATFPSSNIFKMGDRNQIAISKSSPNILYAVTSYGKNGTSGEFFKSTNSGASFFRMDTYLRRSFGFAFLFLYVLPSNPDVVFYGNVFLYRSTNGGESFSRTDGVEGSGGSLIMHGDHQCMDFHPTDPNQVVDANDGGIWKSVTAGSDDHWINTNATLGVTQIYRLASNPLDVNQVIGSSQDNGSFMTTGGSLAWQRTVAGDGGDAVFNTADPTQIMSTQMVGTLHYSSNSGMSWKTHNQGLSGKTTWVTPVTSHATLPGAFYTVREKVFISTNGSDWSALPSAGLSGVGNNISVTPANPDLIYVTSGSKVFKSSNGANTFTDVSAGLPDRAVTNIRIHPDSQNVAVVSLSGFGTGHVFKTTDGAATWSDISGNLPDSPASDVLIYYPGHSTSTYCAATDVGVFYSTNYGGSWALLGEDLPNVTPVRFDHNLALSDIRIATFGRGVWQTSPPASFRGDFNYTGTSPDKFKLHQNYPNPFNPSTTIKYELPENGFVKLDIYDILGRLVERLVYDYQNAGIYEVKFVAGNLPSGTYIYRLNTGGYTEIKRMLIVK